MSIPNTQPVTDARITGEEQTPETIHRPTFAAIYARSATLHDQASQNPLHEQVALCRQYCQAHGYTVQEQHVYREIAGGADYRNRPGLRALLLAATAREFDVVVMLSHERLARHPLHVAAFLDSLESMGIRVELLHEPQETQAQFIQILHTFQVEQERERLKARRQQRIPPRQASFTVEPDEAQLLLTLFEYAASGSELATLATQLTLGDLPPLVRGHAFSSDTPGTSTGDTASNKK